MAAMISLHHAQDFMAGEVCLLSIQEKTAKDARLKFVLHVDAMKLNF